MQRLTAIALLLTLNLAVRAQDDFKPLFNGKDLSGWVNVNGAPSTWFVKDNMIITTGKPTGYLRTDRQYENFILEFEWFHAPTPKGSVGNSGLFVWGDPIPAVGTGYTRSIEVQVLVNLLYKDKKTGLPTATSHGDLFSIWGAKCKPDRPHPTGAQRCLPSEDRVKGEYEWNHYRVTANNGTLKLAVNGKEVSGVTESNPRKGYLALEAEGSECRFKNIKIKELPSTNPKPEEICDVDKGFKSLLTGLDLTGWKIDEEEKANWKVSDGILSGAGKEKGKILWTEKSFGDFELICDYDLGKTLPNNFALHFRSNGATNYLQQDKTGWNRAVMRVEGKRYTLAVNGKQVLNGFELMNVPATGPIAFNASVSVRIRNVFIRELK